VKASAQISELIVQGKGLLDRQVTSPEEIEGLKSDQSKWEKFTTQLFETIFESDQIATEFAGPGSMSWPINPSATQRLAAVRKDIYMLVTALESIHERLDLFQEMPAARLAPAPDADGPEARLTRLLDKFHLVSSRLSHRYNHRTSMRINDEHDVQDLLSALLAIEFDDIRIEERTPSYAGGASRMDFLLRDHRIVVEVKMTRASLTVADLGAELIVDIGRYGEHPYCNKLWCFIYDPGELIQNRRGLAADLEALGDARIGVHVVISPGRQGWPPRAWAPGRAFDNPS